MKVSENYISHSDVRKYEPETGRFLSINSLRENFYAWTPYNYCENDPVNNAVENERPCREQLHLQEQPEEVSHGE